MALPNANTGSFYFPALKCYVATNALLVLVKSVFPATLGALAFAGNIFVISRQIDNSRKELREDMIRMENTLRTDHDVLRNEMRSEFSSVKKELAMLNQTLSRVVVRQDELKNTICR